MILSTGDRLGNLAFREEYIHERLTRNKASFTSIIEGAFRDLSPEIEPEEFYEFLNSDGAVELFLHHSVYSGCYLRDNW